MVPSMEITAMATTPIVLMVANSGRYATRPPRSNIRQRYSSARTGFGRTHETVDYRAKCLGKYDGRR